MADQTHGAVDTLLGLLSSAITDETRLLGGVQGDIQFIKDEMDSMNGFLLHLTKTEAEHDDQLRAWMKQVRDIAYIAEDCIDLYMRDLRPPERGLWSTLRHLPVYLWTVPARHRLANRIRELKVRVLDVGERRLRYGVNVPDDAKPKPNLVRQDSKVDSKRDDFLHALEETQEIKKDQQDPFPYLSKAIQMLPDSLATEAADEIRAILKKCEKDHDVMKMLLRALFAYPYGTKEELTKLEKKLEDKAADLVREVMVFCYSKLPIHYKSCLQYLTTFQEETSISRTCLVRRWVAEGLVARDNEHQTIEEAGERCFDELVCRGFVQPADPVVITGLKIKSCYMAGKKELRDFIFSISKSENFVASLPTHLHYQLEIRKLVKRTPPSQKPQADGVQDKSGAGDDYPKEVNGKPKNPMDEMVFLLKGLREEYRLNVLDLGGCTGLRKRHLKTICNVRSLKYLSLRNTNVSRLPRKINNLRLLETLDIRQTYVPATSTKHIDLPKLKHLLSISRSQPSARVESKAESQASAHVGSKAESVLRTVQMPCKIASSTSMEILSYVQILDGENELKQLGHLRKLRKLGVVLDGKEENIKHLMRIISILNETLCSLRVWITPPPPQYMPRNSSKVVTLENEEINAAKFSPPKYLRSLNIKCYKGDSNDGNLPWWIQDLKMLSKVTIRESLLRQNGLQILGKLESLRCLRLLHGSYCEATITLKNNEFKELRLLVVNNVSANTKKINIEDGAAPMLEKISWTMDKIKITLENNFSMITSHPRLKELELNGETHGHPKLAKSSGASTFSASEPSTSQVLEQEKNI